MTAAPKLFELDTHCGRCGAPPRIRVTAAQISKWRLDPPGTLVETYQCARELRGRRCNHIYPITARAIQNARALD